MTRLNARLQLLLVSLAVWAGSTSAGEWKRHVIDAGSRGADGVRLADVDLDGRLDVVTPWEEGGDVRVAFDRGRESKPRWNVISVGREPSVEDAVAADLDRDGVVEVVAAAEGKAKAVRIFTQDLQSSQWTGHDLGRSRGQQQFMFSLPYDTETHDRILITAGKNKDATISVWSPAGNPSDFTRWTDRVIRKAGWIMSLQAADMNGDGIDDILVSDRKGDRRGVFWIRCNAEGPTRDFVPIGGSDTEVMFLAHGDFDADGDRDVAVAARPQLLLLYERLSADGYQWRERRIAMPENAGLGKGVAIETTHGPTEIFVSSGPVKGRKRLSIVRFVWTNPSQVMTAEPDLIDAPGGKAGTKFDRIELIDLDGDGDRDLLTCEERENLGVVWYERP